MEIICYSSSSVHDAHESGDLFTGSFVRLKTTLSDGKINTQVYVVGTNYLEQR